MKNRSRRSAALTPACLLLAVAGTFATPARADFYIVVQADNAHAAITRKEAVDIYMGRARVFSNDDYLLAFDLPRDNPRRNAFYQALTGMSPTQVNSYWARLMFSGQSMPPQPLPDEAAMLNIVKRNPSAIGWVGTEPTDKQVKVLLVLKEAP